MSILPLSTCNQLTVTSFTFVLTAVVEKYDYSKPCRDKGNVDLALTMLFRLTWDHLRSFFSFRLIHYNSKFSGQIFLCSCIANFTAVVFNSSFDKFQYQNPFGFFQIHKASFFHISRLVDMHVALLLTAIVIGEFTEIVFCSPVACLKLLTSQT